MASVPAILAAVDGSEQSMNAVVYLSHMLSPKNVSIELFHVLADVPEPFYDQEATGETGDASLDVGEWDKTRRNHIDQFMRTARQALVDGGFPADRVSINVQSRQSGIARDIISKADLGYSAVVVGRSGFGSLPEYMPGSVAAKLADTVAHVPLVIVGGQPETRKVVVAFDRSRGIRRGLDQIAPLLCRTLEEIELCHIVRSLSHPHPALTPVFSSRNEAYWLDENSRKVLPAMVNAKLRLSRAGFESKLLHPAILKERTSRADGVVTEARGRGAGTIIVGRRGMTTVEEFTMGRVTRKIFYLASDRAVWIV